MTNKTTINEPRHVVEEEIEVESTTNANSVPSVSELYSMLRDAHENDRKQSTELTVVMPSFFVPELRSYQSKALRWMLQREKMPRYTPSEFVPITCRYIPDKMFYFNYRTVELTDCDPGGLKIPTGGILADEMGLGKTVEMLALILTNPNLKRKQIDADNREASKFSNCKQP